MIHSTVYLRSLVLKVKQTWFQILEVVWRAVLISLVSYHLIFIIILFHNITMVIEIFNMF